MILPDYLEVFLKGLFSFLTTSEVPSWHQLDLYNILHESTSLAALEKVSAEIGWSYQSEVLQKSPHILSAAAVLGAVPAPIATPANASATTQKEIIA